MSQHADVTETHMKCEFMFHLLGVGGLPSWLSGEEASYQCRRLRKCRFDPWVRKTPWRRRRKPTPVFLPGKSRTEESGGLQSMGSYRVRHDGAHIGLRWPPKTGVLPDKRRTHRGPERTAM